MTRDERAQAAMDRLLEVTPPIMREIGYSQRTCILQTRIATVVLRELGFRARPLACSVAVFNQAWCRLARELDRFPQPEDWRGHDDVWCLSVGPHAGATGAGYDGHVVAVVEERHVLDLTIDQCDRPKYEIKLEPHRWEAAPDFLTGVAPAVFTENGSMVRYEALPSESGFLRAADWTEVVNPLSVGAKVNPLPRVREAMTTRRAA